MKQNTQVLLARRPEGRPVPEDFEVVHQPVPTPGPGEALLENLYISMDAGFRNWMDEDAGDEVLPAMALGAPVMGLVVSRVAASRRDDVREGDCLVARTAWEAWSILTDNDWKVSIPDGFSDRPNLFLGLLGDTGLSAYFGLTRVAGVQPGETVLVSAAGGAVGNVAGQVAGILGAGRVVGFAGSDGKCAWLEQVVGYDAAINYHSDDLDAAIATACPAGIDVYFDNVGGNLLDPVLNRINHGARIAFCGAVADYTASEAAGPRNLFRLVAQCARLEGFMTHYWTDHYDAARHQLAAWLDDGRLRNFEAVHEGVDQCGIAFSDLFAGRNHGKTIVKV